MRSCSNCGAGIDPTDIQCFTCGRLTPEENEYQSPSFRDRRVRRVRRTTPGRRLRRYVLVIGIALFFLLPQTADHRGRMRQYPDDPSKIMEDVNNLWDILNPQFYKVALNATFLLERRLTVSAAGGSVDFTIRIPEPVDVVAEDGTLIQHMKDFYWSSSVPLEPPGRSPPWIFLNGSLSSGETAVVTITYSVTALFYEWDFLGRRNSGTPDDIPQTLKDQYLHDEEMIRPGGRYRPLINLSAVSDITSDLVGGTTNVYDMVRIIYDFVRDHVTYQVGTEPKTCLETLEGGVGDCDDMVLLFTAMCRAAGIPAYPGYGFVSNTKFRSWGGHSWAVVTIPDRHGAIYHAHIDLANGKFLWYDPYRVIEWHSDGNEQNLGDYYFFFQSRGSGRGSVDQSLVINSYSTRGEKLIRVN